MKGNEGLDFTIHPQISNVYRHFRRKDEGMKGKIAFRFYIFYAIKIFPKNRMPSRFSRFAKFAKRLRKGTIEPR